MYDWHVGEVSLRGRRRLSALAKNKVSSSGGPRRPKPPSPRRLLLLELGEHTGRGGVHDVLGIVEHSREIGAKSSLQKCAVSSSS